MIIIIIVILEDNRSYDRLTRIRIADIHQECIE